jgi:RecA-family ATPase
MATRLRLIDPAAEWNMREPPPRNWVVPDLVPAGRLTLFSGDGGTGKTLLGQQLATSLATGTQWLGLDVAQGPVLALFGEDDGDELHRRQHAINASLGVEMADVHRAKYIEGVSGDCALWTAKGKGTGLLDQLVEMCRETRPTLVILDNAAAVFMGNELIRVEVTGFCRALEREICHPTGAAVLLLSHPSRAGMASGDGLSGSTAWNAAVRSRIYLRKLGAKDANAEDPDLRVLETPKTNYARLGNTKLLRYVSGAFQLENAGTRDQALVDEHTDALILRAVGILTAAGRTLHPNANQPTWIVKALQGHSLTARTTKATLERRVQALCDRGDLVVNTPKRGGKEIHLSSNAAGMLALEDGNAV